MNGNRSRNWAPLALGFRRVVGWGTRCAVLVAALSLTSTAEGRQPPAPAPAAQTQSAKLAEELSALRALVAQEAERNRALSNTLTELQDTLSRLVHRVGELETDVRQLREQQHNAQEQAREMREEVRGLYVESSGLKGDIAQVSDKIDGLTDNLGNFRLSAGMIAALLVLLDIVAVALILRRTSS